MEDKKPLFGSQVNSAAKEFKGVLDADKVREDIRHILDRVYHYYIGNYILNGKIHSPLRKDKDPSFTIFEYQDTILWKDWGIGRSGNIFQLVAELYNLNLYEALAKINDDFDLGYFHRVRQKIPKKVYDYSKDNFAVTRGKKVKIEVSIRDFTTKDIEYWESYGISCNNLRSFQVYSCGAYKITDLSTNKSSLFKPNSNELSFCYRLHTTSGDFFKIYNPKSPVKWINNIPGFMVLGHHLTLNPPRKDLLVICKAYKDAILLNQIGIIAISPVNEGSTIKKEFIEGYLKKFEKVVVFFDNDHTGIKSAEAYKILYGIDSVRMYSKDSLFDPLLPKDISDFCKEYDLDATKDMLDHIFETQL